MGYGASIHEPAWYDRCTPGTGYRVPGTVPGIWRLHLMAVRLYVAFQGGGPGGARGHDTIGRFNTLSRKLEHSITGLPNVGCKTAISPDGRWLWETADRKSTRLNSSHRCISYA